MSGPDDKVVRLGGGTPQALMNGEPNPKAIEYCEKLLDMAKSGKLQWVASAHLTDDGWFQATWMAREDNVAPAAGILGLLHHEFLAEWSESTR